jgi:hypothetical protein
MQILRGRWTIDRSPAGRSREIGAGNAGEIWGKRNDVNLYSRNLGGCIIGPGVVGIAWTIEIVDPDFRREEEQKMKPTPILQ